MAMADRAEDGMPSIEGGKIQLETCEKAIYGLVELVCLFFILGAIFLPMLASPWTDYSWVFYGTPSGGNPSASCCLPAISRNVTFERSGFFGTGLNMIGDFRTINTKANISDDTCAEMSLGDGSEALMPFDFNWNPFDQAGVSSDYGEEFDFGGKGSLNWGLALTLFKSDSPYGT